MSKIKSIIASILSIFKKKETAESLFARRATVSVSNLEKIMESLKGEDRVLLGAAKNVIEDSRDKFMDFTLADVDSTFDKIDRIIEAIKDATAERANFMGGKLRVNTLKETIRSYIGILAFYIDNTIKRNSPALKNVNIDDILRAASVSAAIEEIEALLQSERDDILETRKETKEIEREIEIVENKMNSDNYYTKQELDDMERDLNSLGANLETSFQMLQSRDATHQKIRNELESAIKYRSMLEEFFASKNIEENSDVKKIYEDAEELSLALKDSNIENETRRLKLDQYYEASRNPFADNIASDRGTRLRAKREARLHAEAIGNEIKSSAADKAED